MFTIWLEKDTEAVDKVTGGPPASVLAATNAIRKSAAEHSAACLIMAALEMGCAQKGESKAAREFFFTPQPHTQPTMVFEYSIKLQGELKVESNRTRTSLIGRRQWRVRCL